MDAEHITRVTLVVKAWQSTPKAKEIFRRHGVDPGDACSVVRETTTLEDAEEWCGLRDLEGLITELNAELVARAAVRPNGDG